MRHQLKSTDSKLDCGIALLVSFLLIAIPKQLTKDPKFGFETGLAVIAGRSIHSTWNIYKHDTHTNWYQMISVTLPAPRI